MLCAFVNDGTTAQCRVCGYTRAIPVGGTIPPRVCSSHGPGDFLHEAILYWTKEAPTSGCDCASRLAQMNAWTFAENREHADEIAAWMIDEAKKRGWKLASVPGAATIAKVMVLRAIRKAERANAK
jgi:hypothetical protein